MRDSRGVGMRDHSWQVARAQRLLRELSIEMAGQAVTMFVVRLLQGEDAGVARDSNIQSAADQIADGPLGLVASEPLLARIDLETPAATVHDAADAAVDLFARSVLDHQRATPVVPRDPPTRQEIEEMRERSRAKRAEHERDHLAQVPIAIQRLRSPRWSERQDAASFLGRFAVQEARPAIAALLDDPYPEVADAAAAALRAIPPVGNDAPAAPPSVALPGFGDRYDAMDAQDAAHYVEHYFEPLSIDLQTWEARYRDPADGSTWVIDYPDSHRAGGGTPRVRRAHD